jgi:hypothetical protein
VEPIARSEYPSPLKSERTSVAPAALPLGAAPAGPGEARTAHGVTVETRNVAMRLAVANRVRTATPCVVDTCTVPSSLALADADLHILAVPFG